MGLVVLRSAISGVMTRVEVKVRVKKIFEKRFSGTERRQVRLV